MRPVFESYSCSVSAAYDVDVDKAVMGWARDYLSLIALRPGRWTLVIYQWTLVIYHLLGFSYIFLVSVIC